MAEKNIDIKPKEITRLREDLNFSIDEFAQLLRVSSRTVHRWENEGASFKQSTGVTMLLSLLELMNDEIAKNEFFKIKEGLTNHPSATWGSAYIAVLGSAIPMFSMVSSGFMNSKHASKIIDAMQNVLDKKEDRELSNQSH